MRLAMKALLSALIISLLLVATPSQSALLHYSGDFSALPGGPPIAGSLTASIDATWNTDTHRFESLQIDLASLPASTQIGNGLLSIGLPGQEYLFSLPMRNSLVESCCGYFFDSTTGLLDFRLDPTYDVFDTLIDDPLNATPNSLTTIAITRGLLSGGFVDFTLYDVFYSASVPLDPTGEAALRAAFVQPAGAVDYPDRIPVGIPAVPLPPALWLFATTLVGLIGMRKSRHPARTAGTKYVLRKRN